MKNKKKIFTLIFSICLVAMGFSFGYCEDLAEEVVLYVGEVKTFSVDMPSRIAIGNPQVADVTSASEKEIVVTAKSAGVTTFVFWDNFGEQDFRIRVFAEDMLETKQRVDNILKELNLPKVYAKAVDSEGKVLLLGEVKTSGDRERLNTALGTLKDKTVDLIQVKEEEAVVDIEVQVLELSKGTDKTLGLTWPTGTSGVTTLTETGSPGISTTGVAWSSLGSLFKIANITRSPAFNLTLSMLLKEGKARILSQPRLTCQSGKEAELLVGGEKPILTTSVAATTGTAGTNVDYKEYGIKLKIKPIVTNDNRIKLALNIEVSEVGEEVTIGGATTTALAYPLTKRNASTEVFLDNGQTMAIGGLIKQKSTEIVEKVPWLADVPILGILFRKKTTLSGDGASAKGDTELFITLTPTIIAEKEVSGDVSQEGKKPAIEVEVESLETKALPLELQNYIKAIQAKIINAVYYPKEARDAGWQGILKLSLLISSDGSLKNMSVAQSSGYKILDDAGQEAVKKITPFSPLPTQLNLEELRIEIPIVYHKDN